MTNAGQCGEEKVRHGGKDRTDGHRLENSQTHRHDAAHESTRERHHDAEHLGDRRDLLLGEARVRIEGVGHHAHDDVGDAVGGDQQQNARRPPAEAHEEVPEGRDNIDSEALGPRAAHGSTGRTGASGSFTKSTVSTPTHMDAAMPR